MKTKKTKVANDGPRDVTEMSLGEIQGYMEMHEKNIAESKAKIETFTNELRRRFQSLLTDALAQQDKQHGQHTFEVDGHKLTGEVRATVKWDSKKLEDIASDMAWHDAQRIFKIEFSVPEKNFQALHDPKLIDKIVDARTVKYSEPKVTFHS
jgi:hypothetical protein